MIRFALRYNLIYILQLIIWNLLRNIEKAIISSILGFDNSIIFTLLMFLGDLIFGSIIYSYQLKFLQNNNDKPSKFMSITLLHNTNELIPPDSQLKIYLLLFFSSFFDFIEFTLSRYYIPKYFDISISIQSRLSGILTISSALFFYYVLKFQIFKHQFFSLLIIGFCLIIVIISEFLLFKFRTLEEFIISLILIFFTHFFNSLLDSIEKYLFEYNYLNPFRTLMWEGIFGSLITLIYYIVNNPIKDIIKYYKHKSIGEFVALIFLLFLYIFLCGGRNTFRVVTNKIYSPMAKTLTDYILNPFYLIYDFFIGNDFHNGKEPNYIYFSINLVISFIISICGCVYNEFIVLFCCELEFDTHNQISKRASIMENSSDENNSSEESSSSNNSNDS